jgi:hypothetical protein
MIVRMMTSSYHVIITLVTGDPGGAGRLLDLGFGYGPIRVRRSADQW